MSAPTICPVCPHHCRLAPGETGICQARTNRKGYIVPSGYGVLSSTALDPIEKKPLARFMPGSNILSIGFYGCNMRCPFCQNYTISQRAPKQNTRRVSPREVLADAAEFKRTHGNIGVAYTYNEPLTNYEYVRDTAHLIHEAGMVNVLVTNGQCTDAVLSELLPDLDAVNVDLKGFRPEIYRACGGDLETTKHFIARTAAHCHVEVTTLIVPGLNDDPDDMAKEAAWLADINPDLTLHLTRYFPMYRAVKPPTPIATLNALKAVAEAHLSHVLLGNV
ncbi:AmmeMemoRadiSam system radical SAM enzyme [uncultured Pseudoramibacter sp.]|uniref:AmmeMemoRadiSam system radical SAM enzyme n=1 Tax=uncultured Pseudoramibacter sp. TaxID=1623493 RepID=UPI0025CD5C49|nr:AmmeMemoRadiSam system radical SAM enzyme [uncultured Pseudoramibacter sp.]